MIGDMGCSEKTGAMETMELADRRAAANTISRVRQFAMQDENSWVLTLFTGADNDGLHQKEDTIRFFSDLANAAQARGIATQDAHQITQTLLRVGIDPEGRQ